VAQQGLWINPERRFFAAHLAQEDRPARSAATTPRATEVRQARFRARPKSTSASPVAAETGPAPTTKTRRCATARSRVASRFCRDFVSIPANPIPNYKVYNSFRSGDLAPPDGKKTPDMIVKVPELCTLECVDNKLVLWVHVGNEGASPLTSGGTLTVNGVVLGQDTMLGTTDLPLVVDPGKYLDAVEYVLDPTDLESIKIKVDAKELECNLNNNEVVRQGPFCQ
jgi:hypothetical protein